jgi:uncharacterized protein YndB with AHSA1/START domain
MSKTNPVIRPDLSSRPLGLTCERIMTEPPDVLFPVWTTSQIGSWFAVPNTVLTKPEVNVPYVFETLYDGQRHPHHRRFLRLEPDRLVELTWVTALGTKGAETVVTVDFTPSGEGTLLRLNHEGFLDDTSRNGHDEVWPNSPRRKSVGSRAGVFGSEAQMFGTMHSPRDRRMTKPVARIPLRPTGVDGIGPAAARRPMKSRHVSMCRSVVVAPCI